MRGQKAAEGRTISELIPSPEAWRPGCIGESRRGLHTELYKSFFEYLFILKCISNMCLNAKAKHQTCVPE